MEFSCILLLLIIFIGVAYFIFAFQEGNPVLVLKADEHTSFILESITADKAVFSTKIEALNKGRQCATIVDCIARTQLPYEQYDGIQAWGKVEKDGVKRQDDYFEATLIEKKTSIFLKIIVELSARKGEDIKTALSKMVDLPIDIIYTELGRRPWSIDKVRIVFTKEEIAQLTGVKLVEVN